MYSTLHCSLSTAREDWSIPLGSYQVEPGLRVNWTALLETFRSNTANILLRQSFIYDPQVIRHGITALFRMGLV